MIIANNTDAAAATFTWFDVPAQGKYNIQNALNSGVATAGGVDLKQWIYNKDEVNKKRVYDLETGYEFIISSNGNPLDQPTTRAWATSGYWQGYYKYGDSSDPDNAGNGIIYDSAYSVPVEANKTYYLIARKPAGDGNFASAAQVIGSFVPLANTSISINLARTVSPNYTGDVVKAIYTTTWQPKDALAFLKSQNTNAVNLSMFSFKFNYPTGLSVVEDGDTYEALTNNTFRVNDSAGNKAGTITLKFYDTYSAGKFSHEVTGAKYYSLTPGLWGVSINFTPYNEASQVYGAQSDSNTISFNVVKAPVKYEPVITPNPSVSGSVVTSDYKATNIVTGAPTDGITGTAQYMINGNVKTNAASFNEVAKLPPAGTYKVSISAGSIDGHGKYATVKEKDDKTGRWYTDYSSVIDWVVVDNKNENLKITGTQKSGNAGVVYYGSDIAAIKASIDVTPTLGGTKLDEEAIDKSDFMVLAAVSADLVHAKQLTNDEVAKISANQTVYAYYKTCTFQSLTASSDAIPVKISKRPIDIIYKDGDKTYLKTMRGADLITSVSASKLNGKLEESVVLSYDENGDPDETKSLPYKGPSLGTLAGSTLIDTTKGPDVKLDTSMLDKNIPSKANAQLTGYTLSSNLLENFSTGADTISYTVGARYYVQYVLEYSGTKGSINKKYVSTNIISKKKNGKDDIEVGDDIVIDPVKDFGGGDYGNRMALSWDGILENGDKITGWKIKYSDFTPWGDIPTYNGKTGDIEVGTKDFVVYAIVTAAATKEGVMVKSIPPVAYDMKAHVETGSTKKNVSKDLDVVLYDGNKEFTVTEEEYHDNYCYRINGVGPYYLFSDYVLLKDEGAGKKKTIVPKLVYGTDYTISVKNNKNASVTYDPSVSQNNGEDGTFKQLFAEKKRPQVVVKGKGNYKTLNTI